jgi:DNA end-binding protein Ku
MKQAVWTGSISFGLVNIPVKLYPATEPKDVRFHLYDRQTGKRVRYERVTRSDEAAAFETEQAAFAPLDRPVMRPPDEDEDTRPLDEDADGVTPPAPHSSSAASVEAEDIVRGFALPSGDLVTVSDDELEMVAPARSRTIDIEEFVDLAEIDPIYFEKSYFVAPARQAGADKPYALLHQAMHSAGMVAIGRFVLRTRPHLVAIRPLERVLALETLFFGDEVRAPEELVGDLPIGGVTERELRTAQQLIRALATEWVPEKHADVYREELLDLLRAKTPEVASQPIEEVARPPVDDLMAALKASVEAAKRRGSSEPARSQQRHRRTRAG